MIKIALVILSKFVHKNLIIMHASKVVLIKIKSAFYLSLAASPFAILVEMLLEWFSVNIMYVQFVLGAIIIDHVLGSLVHAFIERDFSMKKNIIGLFTKCFLVLAVGYLVEGFNHILGSDSLISNSFSVVSRMMVFIYPAGSAFINSSIITKGVFPPLSWMNKIKRFNKDLDLEMFKPNKNKVSDG